MVIFLQLSAAQRLRGSPCCALPMPKFVILGSAGTAVAAEEAGKVRVKFFDPAAAPALEVRDGAVPGRAYGSGEQLPWQEETLETASMPKLAFYDNVAAVLLDGAAPAVTPELLRSMPLGDRSGFFLCAFSPTA